MNGYARSFDEIYLYIALHPCDCGEREVTTDRRSTVTPDGWIEEFSGNCPRCGRGRLFSFQMPRTLSRPGPTIRYGPDSEPSRLLDPGEWLVVADSYADRARTAVAGQQPGTARGLLEAAVAATEEVVKFVPVGAAEVPFDAFRRQNSIELYELDRDRFRSETLARELAVRRQALDELEGDSTS